MDFNILKGPATQALLQVLFFLGQSAQPHCNALTMRLCNSLGVGDLHPGLLMLGHKRRKECTCDGAREREDRARGGVTLQHGEESTCCGEGAGRVLA